MNKKMKMGSQLWNAILAILIGILFVIWPASIIGWAVLFVGILSFLTGLTQLIVYGVSEFNRKLSLMKDQYARLLNDM